MSRYSPHVVADRAGVVPDEIRRLTELGILTPNEGTYTDADVRRVLVVRELERAGFTIDDLARLVREGRLSLAFLDDAGFNVFAAHSDITFAELSAKTGIEVDRLLVLRDVTGGRRPTAQDRVREYELEIVQLVACQIELGFEWPAIERALHVYGDSLRGSPRPRPSGGDRRSRSRCSPAAPRRTSSPAGQARSRRDCRWHRIAR